MLTEMCTFSCIKTATDPTPASVASFFKSSKFPSLFDLTGMMFVVLFFRGGINGCDVVVKLNLFRVFGSSWERCPAQRPPRSVVDGPLFGDELCTSDSWNSSHQWDEKESNNKTLLVRLMPGLMNVANAILLSRSVIILMAKRFAFLSSIIHYI